MNWLLSRQAFRAVMLGFSLLSLTIGVSGCQTTGSTSSSDTQEQAEPAERTYSFFFDQGDHLEELIEKSEFDSAAELYAKHPLFFQEKREKMQPHLEKVAGYFQSQWNPILEQRASTLAAATWPAPLDNWASVRAVLNDAKSTLNQVPNHALISTPEFQLQNLDATRDGVARLSQEVAATSRDDFRTFDHFDGTSFFDVHPTQDLPDVFIEQHFSEIIPLLDTASATNIRQFASVYGADLLGEERWTYLGNRLVASILASSKSAKLDIKSVLSAVAQAKEVGFSIKKIPGLRIGFVEVTSRTLLNQRALDFPVEIGLDLPFESSKSNLDDVLSGPKSNRPDFLVVIDVALAKAERRISGTTKMPARILAGYRTEPNPAHNIAQTEMNAAMMNVQTANMNKVSVDSQYCYGLGCMGKIVGQIAALAGLEEAQGVMKAAQGKLAETPMTLDIPIYQKYNYALAAVKARKQMTVHYYVLDLRKNRYFKSTFDVSERENFDVAYQVHDDDPEKKDHYASARSETDVDDWEDAGTSIKLSQLMNHYLANAKRSKPMPSLLALRKEILKDKNKALAAVKKNTFEGSTKNDPRFDSVVVVYMPDGGLGSGFFVKPDVVMTNYHVVKDGTFVELKMHGGKETFGKVIAKDVRLDLALIKVQERGKPVTFFNDQELDLGSTIEVIGHPRRLEYSITRGVVSAVRKMNPVNINSRDKVLHIQIDAPASPGNSGGPVFMGKKVVSVVSFGRIDQGSQNLNFTVHYSEASRFLSEALGS